MPIPILMPALSPTMEEGTLAKWLVKEGDTIGPGDVIAEIETDKATMEVEAVDEGTVGRLLVDEGTEGIKVNAPIAVLLAEGEDAGALDGYDPGNAGPAPKPAAEAPPKGNGADKEPVPAAAETPSAQAPSSSGSGAKPTPLARRMAAQAGLDLSALGATAPGGKIGKADVVAALVHGAPPQAGGAAAPAPVAPAGGDGERIFASPLARKLARQSNLDLAAITGSGPNDRIVKADIDRVLEQGPDKAAPATAEVAPGPTPPAGKRPYELVKLSNIRKVIAKRLTEADRDVPQFYLTVDCAIDRLLAARKEINEALDGEAKVSVNDLVIKAAALALRKVPAMNAQWSDQGIRVFKTIDVSVAVAFDGGLITPILFDADKKGLAQISIEMKDLAERGRTGKLALEEYQGGGFSISNLGMFGIKQFTAVINPPQGGILAVGAGEQRVVVIDGEMQVATMMSCTLTCDHRVADGALGAQWLQAFKKLIEAPAMMLA
jgi:pyruvate dehydrogenase E2 component (dihydrolipoamide acetyltransferase)